MKSLHFASLFLLFFLISGSNMLAQEFGAVSQAVSRMSNTGHSVQVWEVLPEHTKKGTYEISIQHAVAGTTGSFYLIAWADTNKDGKPDKEIGRSELKTAATAGQWSSWPFSSIYDRIFVGNTWSQNDEKVYYQNGGTLEGYVGLSNKVFYSRTFNGIPNQSTSPRFTNIKVRVVNGVDVFGAIGQQVSRISNTGHSVQVWEVLPENSKRGTYEISIQHAATGESGSFYLIAWADTNNDGKPDKEIGRSDLKKATAAGQWSSWQFNSDYDRIFVGNTWSQNDEKVYYQNGGTLDGYVGLSNKVFYSRTFNGIPNQSTSPRF
ncbi:MAG: hypothetical protein C0599_14060, partial [Salinivirgaceae bacterium]